MQKAFQSYYPPSKEFFDALWKDALIVIDTNVLLDMYRYSDSTRNDFLDLFEKVADRLWVPHQVGLEFSRNRPGVIGEQVQMFQKATSLLSSLRESTAKEIEKILSFRLHPVLSREEFKKAFEDPVTELEQRIENYTKTHPDLLKNDPILDSLLRLLDGRVGSPFDEKRLEEIYKEGKQRYEKDLPPGYEDARGSNKKEGNAIYGDLVLWFQILKHVKASKISGVIFVCNDMKEDWWWKSKGRNLGCRPELRDELYAATGASFHIYTSEQFLRYAPEHIKIQVKEESIDEVRTLEKKNRDVSEKAAGVFADSLLTRIFEDQAKRDKMLSGINPLGLAALAEDQRKRQEALNKVLNSSFGSTGAFAKLAETIRKQEENSQKAFGSLGWLGSLKTIEEMSTPSWYSLLGTARGVDESSDDAGPQDSPDSDADGEAPETNEEG